MRTTPDDIREVLDRIKGHRYERTEVQALFDSLNTMRDENDRLRSALNDIDDTADFFVQDGISADAMRGGHYMIRSKAQAALGHQSDDPS